jgi:hypothetical protein
MRALALVFAVALLPASAQAQDEVPTIVFAGQEDGRITVKWQLPSDEWKNDLVELGRSSDTSGFEGGFRDRDVVDVIPPRAAQREATFIRVRPGTYFVHVSMLRKRCQGADDESCITPTWSEVKKVVVPESAVPRRYRGATSQDRNVSFTVEGRKVMDFTIGYFTLCARGFQRGRLEARNLRLRRDGTFRERARFRNSDGSTARIRLRGKLRGQKRARGTFNVRARGTPAGACGSGRITWRANGRYVI